MTPIHIIELIITFIVGGLAAGFTSGMFGLGGGAVLVPLLLFLLPKLGASPNATMHQAVGTSLAIIVFSTFSASLEQYKTKNLALNILKPWLPFVLLGIIGATFVFSYMPALLLEVSFMVYLLLCAAYMVFKKVPKDVSLQDEKKIPLAANALAGTFVGALSIFLGVGGGTFTVPFYLTYQYSLKRAIALSSATGFFVGIFGACSAMYSGHHALGLARYSIGYVNLLSLLIITPFSIFSAIYGVKINHRLSEKTLNTIYVLFLFLIIAYVYYHTFL